MFSPKPNLVLQLLQVSAPESPPSPRRKNPVLHVGRAGGPCEGTFMDLCRDSRRACPQRAVPCDGGFGDRGAGNSAEHGHLRELPVLWGSGFRGEAGER